MSIVQRALMSFAQSENNSEGFYNLIAELLTKAQRKRFTQSVNATDGGFYPRGNNVDPAKWANEIVGKIEIDANRDSDVVLAMLQHDLYEVCESNGDDDANWVVYPNIPK